MLIGLASLVYAIAFASPCAPHAPVCRSTWPVGFIFAGLVIAVGIAHVAIGIGLVRGTRIAQFAGLATSVGGLLFAAYLGQSAFRPISFIDLDPATPGLEPVYNNNLIASIAVALAYGVVAVVLLISIRRGVRPAGTRGHRQSSH